MFTTCFDGFCPDFAGDFASLTLKVCLPRVLTDFAGVFASLTLPVCFPRVLTDFAANFASLTLKVCLPRVSRVVVVVFPVKFCVLFWTFDFRQKLSKNAKLGFLD